MSFKSVFSYTSFRTVRLLSLLLLTVFMLSLSAQRGAAQGLNWEGQTGAFITPFAYTSQSPAKGVGHPQLAFHYLNTGSVVGNDFQASVTLGFVGRAEVGYTRAIASAGNNTSFSPLFKEGFNIVHAKVNLVPENANKSKAIPAISVGFVARTQVKRVGGVLTNKETTNGDVYVVATKTITQIKGLPILLNFGVKATNASLMGIAGNAPEWTARMFGAAAFVVKGPSKSLIILGSEFAQQPHFIKDLPGATIPTTMTYFVRLIPSSEIPLNFDFGVAQAANKIAPGVALGARNRFAMGISYRF